MERIYIMVTFPKGKYAPFSYDSSQHRRLAKHSTFVCIPQEVVCRSIDRSDKCSFIHVGAGGCWRKV